MLLHPGLPTFYFRIYQTLHSSLDSKKQKLKNTIIKELKKSYHVFRQFKPYQVQHKNTFPLTLSNVSNTCQNANQSFISRCCLQAKVTTGHTLWLFRMRTYVTLAKVNAESISPRRYPLRRITVIFNLVFGKNQLLQSNLSAAEILYSANPLQLIIFLGPPNHSQRLKENHLHIGHTCHC